MKSVSFVVTAFLVALAPTALAEPNDPAAAQVLFYEGRALMQQGRFTEACAKLEESQRLDAGIGTEFNLAECQERVGKIATAWAGFLEVAGQAKASGQTAREKVARQRAQALESRLPKLVVDVRRPATGMEVKRDGEPVGGAAWNTPIPVDAGVHRIVVTAPGKEPWETTVVASEGAIAHVAVPADLVAIAPVAGPASSPEPTGQTRTTASQVSFPPPIEEGSGRAQRTIAYLVGAVGIAGLGVGGAFGLRALDKRDQSRDHCSGNTCDAAGVSLKQDAIHAGDIATIASIAGGAALLGGIVLLATAPSGDTPRAGEIRAAPRVATNGGGFFVEGSFR